MEKLKTLYLLRHAKSCWQNPDLADHDRPLNERGQHDAPFMGKILKKKGILPDQILCSTALRTQKTAVAVANEIGFSEKKIVFLKELYHASFQKMITILKTQKKNIDHIFLVGHNPDLTELANYLSQKNIDNIPTTGIVGIGFRTDDWAKISPENAQFLFFDYPKKHYL